VFDEDGLLRDGARYRVPATLMDGMPPRRGDNVTSVDAALHRPGFRFADQRAQQRVADARAAYETDLINSWRKDADEDWGDPGDQCTVRSGGVDEGAPGHLRRINGRLVCVPDDDDDETERATGDARRRVRKTTYDPRGRLVSTSESEEEDLDDSASVSVAERMRDHQARMNDEYAAYDARLREEYRKG
jgi:hypothetical protein